MLLLFAAMSGPFPGSGWVPGLDPPNDNRVLNGACKTYQIVLVLLFIETLYTPLLRHIY